MGRQKRVVGGVKGVVARPPELGEGNVDVYGRDGSAFELAKAAQRSFLFS